MTESSSAVEYCGLPSIPWIYRAFFLLVNPTKLCEEWYRFSRAEAMLGLRAKSREACQRQLIGIAAMSPHDTKRR